MTEKELQILGFEKQVEEGSQCSNDTGKTWIEDAYYYYTYVVCEGLSFISESDDVVVGEDGWSVEFFNTETSIKYTKFEELQSLINNLERHKV